MSASLHDVAVLGGGPAGSVTAGGLARLGFTVVLITRPRPHLAFEGLSQRTLDGLEAAGCERALGRVGAEVQRRATWSGQASAANTEFVVDRGAFDAALAADAAAQGVEVHAGRITELAPAGDRWRLGARLADGETRQFATGFVVEARGREAPAAGARRRRGPPTTALSRPWALPAGAGAHTAVAAFAQGWAWLAAPGDGRAVLQLFVASGRGRLPPRRELEDFYARRLEELAEGAEWLRGASPAGPVSARESTPQIALPLVGPKSLRVGDAALAIDPLSGHGVFAAVGGALAAAPVINTLLRRPADRDLAAAFYAERAETAFLSHCRVGRDFYAQEERWPEAPFWTERRRWPDAEPAHRPARSGAPEIAWRPVIEDGFVVRREVITTPDHPRGVWQVDGVALVALLQLAEALLPTAADEIRRRAAARLGVPSARVETALAWLRHRGLLR